MQSVIILGNKKDVTEDVIDAIVMTDTCKEFGVLPRSGGYLEQDQLDIRKMNIVIDARHTQAEREREKKK